VFIKLGDLCIKGIQWTCRCFVGKKAGTAYTGFTSMNTPGFGLRHRLREQLLASPRGTPVTMRYKTSQHICKQVHQQNHPVVKEYWFGPGYEFLYISWDRMGVLTSRLGGRPTVDQQPASRMKKRGTWVAKCSPNRAGSGGCGCEWGGGLKGLFID